MNLASIGALGAGALVGATGSYSTYRLIATRDEAGPTPGRISEREVLGAVVGGTAVTAALGGMFSLIRTTDVGTNADARFAVGLAVGGAVGWAAAGVTALVKRMQEH